MKVRMGYNAFIFENFDIWKKYIEKINTQLTFTSSKSVIETLEEGVKYIQS